MTQTDTKFQPILPPSGVLTSTELHYAEETPYGVFPGNQDSNWGFFRKIFSDELRKAIEQLDLAYRERFIKSSVEFLDEHETMLGLPADPENLTLSERRARLFGRLHFGAFTKARRRQAVENYILATYGSPIQLLPGGVALVSAGVPLYAESGAQVANFYRIYENVEGFAFLVKVGSAVSPDITAMQREFLYMTPAGITPYFDFSDSSPLDYKWEILDTGPRGYWRMQTLNDEMSNRSPMVNVGGIANPTVVSGLLTGDTDQARSFVTDDYQQIPATPWLNITGKFSVEAIVKIVTPPTTNGDVDVIWSGGDTGNYLSVVGISATDRRWYFSLNLNGMVIAVNTYPSGIAVNTIYHLVAVYDGERMRVYQDGVEIATTFAAYNMLRNPSFEDPDLSSWNVGYATMARDNTVAGIPVGSWALKVTAAGTPAGQDTYIWQNCAHLGISDTSYLLSAQVRTPKSGVTVLPIIAFFAADGRFLYTAPAAPTPLTPNTWTTISFSQVAPFESTVQSLVTFQNLRTAGDIAYVDIVQLTGSKWGGNASDVSMNARQIGAYTGGGAHFTGVIDEVAVYDRALTPEEILRHFKTAHDQL